MPEVSRRSFMQMFGLGGLATTAGVVSGLRMQPLFGSELEAPTDKLMIPDYNCVSGHYVVYAKGLVERIPIGERAALEARCVQPGTRVVARMSGNRDPGGDLLRGYPPREGVLNIPSAHDASLDPHAAFYLSSMKMRDQFSVFSRETLKQIDPVLRPMVSLVTVIHSEIHARATGLQEHISDLGADSFVDQSDRSAHEDRGFDLACSFTQHIRVQGAKEGTETFSSYSETGEYTVQTPRDIDISLLMKLDKEVMGSQDRSWMVGRNRERRLRGFLSGIFA